MKKMRTHILLTALAVFVSAGLYAQSMQSICIPSDPATLELGFLAAGEGAFAPDGAMASSVFRESRLDVAGGYGIWAPSVSGAGTASAGVTGRLGKDRESGRLDLGLCGKAFLGEKVQSFDENGAGTGVFKPVEASVSLGAAYRINGVLSAGVSVKGAYSALLSSVNAASVAVDISAVYNTGKYMAGLAFTNIGSRISYAEGVPAGSLPAILKAGARWEVIDKLKLYCEADLCMNASSALMATAGLVLSPADMIDIRAGYHYGGTSSIIPSYTAAGLNVKLGPARLRADYILNSEMLAGTLQAGIGLSF